ncbi:MAG: sortase [Candidatus Andersenbacteria bacterium]
MRTGFRHTLWSLGVIAAFIAGTGTGVYYYNEIMVVSRSLFLNSAGDVAGTHESLPPLRADQSFVMLPAFAQSLPLVYSETLEEERIQEYLKEGAVVLPLGKSFGEPGNVVVTAHSSGTEAFGPYRFAFAELSELQEGQEYTITTTTAVYTYRVYGKEVVWPHEVDKLPNDDRSTVTLVTCWPVWTNFKRLLVHSELVKTEYKI